MLVDTDETHTLLLLIGYVKNDQYRSMTNHILCASDFV